METVSGKVSESRVIVVDDERAITDLVVSLLQAEGFDVQGFTDPNAAVVAFEEGAFDLAILDVMMPQMNGFELCAKMRAVSDIPIVFLSARDEETDQVAGFALGADDYIAKPFKPRELIARVRAHLRRAKIAASANPVPSHVLVAGTLEMDLKAHHAMLNDTELSLTPKEFDMLALLMQRQGSPVSVAEIFQSVWRESFDDAAANTVMVHIRHLRAKLGKVDSSREFIQTVWGVGYKLAVSEPSAAESSAVEPHVAELGTSESSGVESGISKQNDSEPS